MLEETKKDHPSPEQEEGLGVRQSGRSTFGIEREARVFDLGLTQLAFRHESSLYTHSLVRPSTNLPSKRKQ